MNHRLSLLLLTVLAAAAFPASAEAQIRLAGLVRDDATEQPVAGARVEIFDFFGTRIGTRFSAADGTFEYPLRRPGAYRLRVARLGYTTATTPEISTGAHAYINVEVRLKSDAVLMAPLSVVARSGARPSPVLDNFYSRLRTGMGSYYTREDVQRLQPMYVSDLVTRHAGLHVATSGSGRSGRIFTGRAQGIMGECPVQIYVDGLLLNPAGLDPGEGGLTLDEAVSPASVEGIEIYRGLATVPAEFLNQYARCGVVAVWTRRGDRR